MARILSVFLLLSMMLYGCKINNRNLINDSVNLKLATYPESTLKDLYKSYFQDYFGPGHAIQNPAGARKYFDYELGLDDYKDTVLLDPTGYKGNFYRVNMILLKEEVIPPDTFFDYFVESVNSVDGISLEEWIVEWQEIFSFIENRAQDLENFESDKIFIDSLLNSGNYVVHHSEKFKNTYHPHYRIIHRDIFDAHLATYLKK